VNPTPASLESQPAALSTGTSRRTLLRTFRTAAAGATLAYIFNLALLPFILHRVGSELYGAWATIASVLAIGGLADAGVRTEIIRRVGAAKGAGDDTALVASVHQGLSLLAALAGAVFVLGAIGAPVIRTFAFPGGVAGYPAAEIDNLIRGTFAVLTITLMANAYFGVLRGLQRGDVEILAQMLAVPVGGGVILLGLAFGWGLWALFAGTVANLLIILGWEWAYTLRLVPFLRPRIVRLSRIAGRGYLALSGLALLSQISDVIDSQWDKLVLSHFVGSSAVTSFQIGTGLALQGKALALLPLGPLLVTVSELRLGDRARLRAIQRVLTKAGMVVGAVVLGGIFVFAPAFLRLWLGEGEGAAGSAARLFVFAVAMNLVSAPLAFRAFGEGWHGLAAIGSVVNMVVNGALSLVLTILIGFNGALYGSIAGNFAGTAVFLVLIRRRLGTEWTWPPLSAAAVGSVAAFAAILLGAGQVRTWPSLGASIAAYVVVVGFACGIAERLPVRVLLRPTQ
jgi:O-antigen/teichoic acid export membrane protein